ncbi:hypothetical protein [Pseudoalteromonas gelatinilytica]|uniref:hypothetical protein n=1 Tax=Pseudoalteromonas gelatinilytica TaxID=1703256 RepID=UPI0007C57DD8|nr:hypothetical protein [Pseudoalteromonas gelatinilytica]
MNKKTILALFIFVSLNLLVTYFSIIPLSSETEIWTALNALATMNIAILTAFLAFYGLQQLHSIKKQTDVTKEHNQSLIAHSAYSEYLKLAMEYPQFAHPNIAKLDENYELKNHYKWFVANMLYHFETVVEAMKGDDDWEVTLIPQIKKHGWYIYQNDRYKKDGWSSELKELIKKAEKSYTRTQRQKNNDTIIKSKAEEQYQRYLNLLAKNHNLLAEPSSNEKFIQNSHEYKVFYKQIFFILGGLAEIVEENPNWKKTITNELKSLDWFFCEKYMNLSGDSYFVNGLQKELLLKLNHALRKLFS